jgi:hypothetical protein
VPNTDVGTDIDIVWRFAVHSHSIVHDVEQIVRSETGWATPCFPARAVEVPNVPIILYASLPYTSEGDINRI